MRVISEYSHSVQMSMYFDLSDEDKIFCMP